MPADPTLIPAKLAAATAALKAVISPPVQLHGHQRRRSYVTEAELRGTRHRRR